MKKTIIISLVLCAVIMGHAQTRKSAKRPLIELGPKASLYIGSLNFGIGAELLINPTRNVGLRFGLAELRFGEDDTRFSLNLRDLSMDGILYIPMEGIKPYAFLGFGIVTQNNTNLEFRGGLGFNYSVTRSTDIFVEPGAIFAYNSYDEGSTDIWFRLSVGGRFGLIR
jgi:hypothetical protein